MSILLGEGVFAIGATNIALTRGGGQFTVEREYRQMEADGDKGPVKGRIRKTGSIAKLQMNVLEIVAADLSKLYPATSVTNDALAGTDTFTGKDDIEDADYNATVTWTGTTSDGKSVVITLEDAINLENLDWTMADKNEVVPQVTYTATYDETTRDTEPWNVVFTDPA